MELFENAFVGAIDDYDAFDALVDNIEGSSACDHPICKGCNTRQCESDSPFFEGFCRTCSGDYGNHIKFYSYREPEVLMTCTCSGCKHVLSIKYGHGEMRGYGYFCADCWSFYCDNCLFDIYGEGYEKMLICGVCGWDGTKHVLIKG